MTEISVTELKANAGKFVEMAGSQDIFITKNGKVVAKLTSAKLDKVAVVKSMFGIIKGPIDLDQEKEERLR